MPPLLGGTPTKPAPVKAPAVMPVQDDASVMAAKRAKQAAAMQRTGRQSTIISQNKQTDTLG